MTSLGVCIFINRQVELCDLGLNLSMEDVFVDEIVQATKAKSMNCDYCDEENELKDDDEQNVVVVDGTRASVASHIGS